eukprot:36696-Eustigmatos_ZCMA.PRE.1
MMSARDMLHHRIFTKTAMSALNKCGQEWYGKTDGLGGLIGALCADLKGATQHYVRVWEIDIK